MSNRRRHFPFVGKGPATQPPAPPSTSSSSSYEMGKSRFHLSLAEQSPFNDDSNSFISNIHKCLTSCASYTQALNTLCGAGTHFAKCLVNLFHNLQPYQEIAGQFLDIWENLSKATGSASAAVKTETLINLQDILTRLETSDEDSKQIDDPFLSPENVQILFTCLNSFLRLQALFSSSSWESLNKLTRNFEDSQEYTSPPHPDKVEPANDTVGNHLKPLIRPYPSYSSEQTYQSNKWKPPLQSNDHSRSETPVSITSSPKMSFQEASNKNFASAEELQDVLELLSCQPDIAQSCPSLHEKNIPNIPGQYRDVSEPQTDNLSSQGMTIGSERELQRHDMGKRTWPRMNGNVNPADWGWMVSQTDSAFQYGLKMMNYACSDNRQSEQMMADVATMQTAPYNALSPTHQKQPSDVSVTSDGHTKSCSSTQGDSSSSSEDTGSNDTENVFSIGLNIVVSDLMASVRQRRHSSTDGLPEADSIDDNPSLQYDQSNLAKTSTWPLKQHNPRLPNQPPPVFFGGQDHTSSSDFSNADNLLWNPVMDFQSTNNMEKYSLFGKNN